MERLTHYFLGNDAPKEKQVSLFITWEMKIRNFSATYAGKSHKGASCRNYAKSPATAAKCNIAVL